MSQLSDDKTVKSNSSVSGLYDRLIAVLHRFILGIGKNIILFIVCVAIPVTMLVIVNNAEKNQYKSSFTVAYDDLVRKIYGDRLEKINALITHGNYGKVSYLLGLPVNTAKTLVKVKGSNILGQDLTEDMNTDRIPFIVTVTVKDTSKIPEIQERIVSFLEEGNAYMAEKKSIKIKEIQKELDFINEQLNLMDSLKRKFDANSISVSDMKASNYTNVSANTIYQFSYELYKRKQELERKKSMPANVQVIDDAIAPTSVRKSIITVVLMGLVAGTILYIIMLYFLIPVFRGRR